MSNMKSKHAFGSKDRVQAALGSGAIDAYDVLFFDSAEIGWVDKNGNVVMAKTQIDTSNEQFNTVVDEKVSDAVTAAVEENLTIVEF